MHLSLTKLGMILTKIIYHVAKQESKILKKIYVIHSNVMSSNNRKWPSS